MRGLQKGGREPLMAGYFTLIRQRKGNHTLVLSDKRLSGSRLVLQSLPSLAETSVSWLGPEEDRGLFAKLSFTVLVFATSVDQLYVSSLLFLMTF